MEGWTDGGRDGWMIDGWLAGWLDHGDHLDGSVLALSGPCSPPMFFYLLSGSSIRSGSRASLPLLFSLCPDSGFFFSSFQSTSQAGLLPVSSNLHIPLTTRLPHLATQGPIKSSVCMMWSLSSWTRLIPYPSFSHTP